MADQQLIAGIQDPMDRTERSRARNYNDPARDLVREAQGIWSSTLGIPRSDFSPEVWREVAVTEIQDLMDREETYRARIYFDPARDRVRQAQGIWPSTLGIPRPGFSNEVRRQLDIIDMEQISALADRNAIDGWEDGAPAAVQAARTIGERLAEPRPPRPELSQQVSQHLSQTGQRGTWKPSHLSTVEGGKYFCPICIHDRDEDSYKHNDCENKFCIGCLDKWADYSRSCPMCRRDM
jgi:hypothetical protein